MTCCFLGVFFANKNHAFAYFFILFKVFTPTVFQPKSGEDQMFVSLSIFINNKCLLLLRTTIDTLSIFCLVSLHLIVQISITCILRTLQLYITNLYLNAWKIVNIFLQPLKFGFIRKRKKFPDKRNNLAFELIH